MKRQTYILIGLFLALLLTAVLILQKPGEQSSSSASSGLMFDIDSLAVDKIEIKSPTTSVVLEKRGVEWFVAQPINYKADQSNVANLIGQVKNIEMKSTVSSKPEKHAIFQVDTITGTKVSVFEKGSEKAAFIVGKMGPNYTETYARKYDNNDVLLVQGIQNYAVNKQVKDWRDKTIFATSKENIKEVSFQYGDTTFTLAFKDSLWSIGRENAQQSVVDGILNSLTNFQANDFVDSTITPKFMATVSYAGVQIRFSYDKYANNYRVQTSNSQQWFVVDAWKANQILKRKKDIVESSKK